MMQHSAAMRVLPFKISEQHFKETAMTNPTVPLFIRGRVAITELGPIDEKDITPEMDVIFIRPKMDFGTQQKVLGAAAKMVQRKNQPQAMHNPSERNKRRLQKKSTGMDAEFDLGAYNVALMNNNILSWQGPMFAGINCNDANISTLNQDHPLTAQVLKEINDRNVKKTDDEENDEEIDTDNVIHIDPNDRSMQIYIENTGS